MTALETKVSQSDPDYAKRSAHMLEALEEVRRLEATILEHGARAREKFESRGQLLPRERVERLLDPDTDFLELSSLAGLRMHDDNGRKYTFGGGNIVGVGVVEGVRCMVVANDSAIKGGTITPMGLRKSLRAQEIALTHHLPCLSLVESGGANLMYQSELFVEGGRVFANMARLSAAGIPQITIVHGSSTAGGAYMPGLSDYVIGVQSRAKMFLAGPPLVKAALGEDAQEAELGGASMHASVTGSIEYLARDDAHAVELCRTLVHQLPWPRVEERRAPVSPPAYHPSGLLGVVPVDARVPYDPREIVARIADGSRFLELHAEFGTDTVCGHAQIAGHRVGVVANAGPIQPDGSAKAAHFIELCGQSRIPIVYLQNTTGYMVGTAAEQAGAIKHGAKMIQAVANAEVPQLTLIVGGGYGAGYYGMCGRPMDPRFIFAWPNAKVAVMGPTQAGMVMEQITRAKHARRELPLDEDALRKMKEGLVRRLELESHALHATARLWDDGIIDPRDSRRVLALCLDICAQAQTISPRGTHSAVPRF